MSRYKIKDQHGFNFVTLTVVDWVDVFIRKQYRDILIESLRYCQKEKGLVKEGWVSEAEHYLYSSASNYRDGTGVLEIRAIELPMTWYGYVPVMEV